MPNNGFCGSFLIKCSNKVSFLDNTCMLMVDFNIDLHKLHSNNVTSKFLEVMTSCFFVPYIQQPACVAGSSARLVDNFFVSSIEFVIVLAHLAITCSKLTIKTLEHGVKYVQS